MFGARAKDLEDYIVGPHFQTRGRYKECYKIVLKTLSSTNSFNENYQT